MDFAQQKKIGIKHQNSHYLALFNITAFMLHILKNFVYLLIRQDAEKFHNFYFVNLSTLNCDLAKRPFRRQIGHNLCY